MSWPWLALAGIGAALAATWGFGRWRWARKTARLRAVLDAGQRARTSSRIPRDALDALPPPIAGHLRRALPDDARRIAAVDIVHRGTFNLDESGERWRPFTSRQRVVTDRPGFVWDGRVTMLPGLAVHVHDAYVAGEGILEPAVLGLWSVMKLRDRDATARGELMRFLAESPWYPTALAGFDWQPIDERSARATLVDDGRSVSMVFHVGDDGLVDTIRADARSRRVGDRFVDTPWEGRMSRYERRDDVLVPFHGEVAWLTPEGRLPYWRGQIEAIGFAFS